MIFNKLRSLTSFRSVTVILRNYNGNNFQHIHDKLYVKQLLKQQQQLETVKYSPSQIYIQVIGPGTPGECRAILLVTDHIKYLFNCGEGTQRLVTEYHANLSKLQHIFVTKPTWDNMGGIPGVAVDVRHTGTATLYLHGPDDLSHIIDITKQIMNLNQLSVVTTDTTKEFRDQTMTVTYIPILNPEPVKDDVKKPFKETTSDYVSRINSMMVFVCKIHQQKGSLNFEKCVAAGVEPGSDLIKLKSGEDITLKNGRIVRYKDVFSSSDPGPLFIVLECPSENWIDVVVDNPAFHKYQLETATDEDQVARCVIHFSPENVLQNSKYKEWISKFGLKTQHLVVNENNTGYTSETVHKMQHQLHLLHPDIFPIFGDQQNFIEISNKEVKSSKKLKIEGIKEAANSTAELEISKNKNKVETSTTTNNNEPIIHQCETLNTFHLRPDKGLDTKRKVKVHPKRYVKEVIHTDGFQHAHAALQKKLESKIKTLGDREEFPKLLMLGTGSSVSINVRNKSGILLQLDEDTSIVLDCGEGTMGQLLRFFGKSKIDRVLKSIKAVYISHLHADHHFGFIGLVKQRERVTDEALFLLAPQKICLYLYFYHTRFESIIKQFRLISNEELLMNQCTLSPRIAKDMYDLLGLDKINTCLVTHCQHAYGVAITLKDGRKICYSGDTMPCDNVVKLASDSFLLIHESTMDDSKESDAIINSHSTISQAINIGVKAKAQFTLLTHFSHYCGKVPRLPLNKLSSVDYHRIGIAYDFMSVSLSELPLLSCFYPCLACMFQEHRIMLNDRTFNS